MSSMVLVLSVLASWTSIVAAKGPDPSCLLQMVGNRQNSEVASEATPVAPEGWIFLCKPCACKNFASTSTHSLEQCVVHCANQGHSVVGTLEATDGNDPICACCTDTAHVRDMNQAYPVVKQESTMWQKVSSADDVGDPHIKTLDGRKYTLLSQGTFLLWRLAMETQFQSGGEDGEDGEVTKAPLDLQIYTHYSGHQSFTKGLLLVDMSGGSTKVLEITTQKCEWRARTGNHQWIAVKSSDSELIDAAGNDVTTFNLVTTNGAKFHNQVQMHVKTKDGKTGVAVLRLSCRPNHNLNLHLTMQRRGDEKHVEGEVKMARKALSTLQTSTSIDSEFSVAKKWQELGGSDEAAAYLHGMDELIEADTSKLQECNSQEKNEFEKTCSKHLRAGSGGISDATFTDFLSDCIYDMCRGAGETAAELAAELLAGLTS